LVKWVQFDYIILFKWVGSTTTNYPGLGEDSRWSSLRASSGPRWRWSVIRTVDGNQKSRRENQLRLVNTLPETNSSHLKMDGWINYLPFGFGPIFRCELLVAGRISHYIQGFIHVMWLFGISEPSTVEQGSWKIVHFERDQNKQQCRVILSCFSRVVQWLSW